MLKFAKKADLRYSCQTNTKKITIGDRLLFCLTTVIIFIMYIKAPCFLPYIQTVFSSSWFLRGDKHVLWFMGSQRVRHDWATKLNWNMFITLIMMMFHRYMHMPKLVYRCICIEVYTLNTSNWSFLKKDLFFQIQNIYNLKFPTGHFQPLM